MTEAKDYAKMEKEMEKQLEPLIKKVWIMWNHAVIVQSLRNGTSEREAFLPRFDGESASVD